MGVLKRGEADFHISLYFIILLTAPDKSLKNVYTGFDTVRQRVDCVVCGYVTDL